LRCKTKSCEYYPSDRVAPAECGQTVLIWGDHFGAADAAEKLGHSGKKVYLVTPNREFAEWMEPCHRDVMFKRFRGSNGEGLKGKTCEHPVSIISQSSIVEIKADGEVMIMDSKFNISSVKVDNVVLSLVETNDQLYNQLFEAGLKVIKIGDALKVRNVNGAVTDGANAALTLEKDAG
jgi:thioredoxin reductase